MAPRPAAARTTVGRPRFPTGASGMAARTELDLYARYFRTRGEGDSGALPGDTLTFDAAESHRARAAT